MTAGDREAEVYRLAWAMIGVTRDGNRFRVDHLGDGVCVVEWVPGGVVYWASWDGFAPRFWPDPPAMAKPTRRLWSQASTLADLGELTACWLDGSIDAWPGYGGGVDVDEDIAPGLTAALVAANCAGLVTTSSQAGRQQEGLAQLAWVDGFAAEGTLSRFEIGDRYQVIRHDPHSGYVPVTRVDGQIVTSSSWMPRRVVQGEIYPGIGHAALVEVFAAVQFAILDPVPGRNTLWSDLLAACQRMGR